MTWSNTAHITQADEDEHEARMNLKRIQKRIHNLRKVKPEDSDFKVETYYIGPDEDVVDVLHAMLDGKLDDEGPEDEDDKP